MLSREWKTVGVRLTVYVLGLELHIFVHTSCNFSSPCCRLFVVSARQNRNLNVRILFDNITQILKDNVT